MTLIIVEPPVENGRCDWLVYDIFIHVFMSQESFKTAKLAYRQFKLRVRKTLSPSHFGPESLEDAAVDYIVRNLDLYDVQTSVNVGLNKSSYVLCSIYREINFVSY